MPHHHSNPIDAYLSDAVIANRKYVTRACDRCRGRKTACDGERPICSRCHRDNVECTYLAPSNKRGPKAKIPSPATDHCNSPLPSDDLATGGRSSVHGMFASKDPFSKEVTDHLISIFFTNYFDLLNFLNPVDFLKEYTTGTLNPDPLYAVCAISARLSEHPAVLKSPPSSNGQVYVRHIRSRIPYLISQVNLEMVHTITLIAKSEYAAGNLAQEYRLDGIAQQMVIEYKSGQGESRSGSGGGTERGGSTQDEYSEDTKDQQEDGLQVVQMYLTKSVLAADEIIAIVDQFTDEEIKICGPPYSFPMFIAGTVYVMQQFMDKTSNLTGEVEKKLMTCQRFLRALGPYWKGASDQALLLKRLSLSGGSGSGGGGGDGGSESRAAHGTSLSSSALPMGSLMEFMVSSPSMFAYETEDFTIGHISLTGEEQEASSTAHLKSDLQADISLERLLDTSGKQKEGKPEAKGAMNVFMTTDTGVGTLWRRPEKMAELKEATLLSLEKLSMFESHLSKDSS